MGNETENAGQAGVAAATGDPGVSLILNSEDSAPFDLQAMLIPLGITKEQFKAAVGGTAAA